MIDITGIDKATLVAALFNNSKPLNMGFFAPKNNSQMTPEDAQKYLDRGESYFDYLNGRVMKINVAGDTMNPAGYDRDNGPGAANSVVEAIRNEQAVNFKGSTATNALEAAAASGNADLAIKLANEQMHIHKI